MRHRNQQGHENVQIILNLKIHNFLILLSVVINNNIPTSKS